MVDGSTELTAAASNVRQSDCTEWGMPEIDLKARKRQCTPFAEFLRKVGFRSPQPQRLWFCGVSHHRHFFSSGTFSRPAQQVSPLRMNDPLRGSLSPGRDDSKSKSQEVERCSQADQRGHPKLLRAVVHQGSLRLASSICFATVGQLESWLSTACKACTSDSPAASRS